MCMRCLTGCLGPPVRAPFLWCFSSLIFEKVSLYPLQEGFSYHLQHCISSKLKSSFTFNKTKYNFLKKFLSVKQWFIEVHLVLSTDISFLCWLAITRNFIRRLQLAVWIWKHNFPSLNLSFLINRWRFGQQPGLLSPNRRIFQDLSPGSTLPPGSSNALTPPPCLSSHFKCHFCHTFSLMPSRRRWPPLWNSKILGFNHCPI